MLGLPLEHSLASTRQHDRVKSAPSGTKVEQSHNALQATPSLGKPVKLRPNDTETVYMKRNTLLYIGLLYLGPDGSAAEGALRARRLEDGPDHAQVLPAGRPSWAPEAIGAPGSVSLLSAG